MSIWVKDVRGKVYGVESVGNVVKAKLSTAEKDQKTEQWVNSNWFVAFVGNCKAETSHLSDGDKITVTKGKISNVYNKEKKQAYLNFAIFAFDAEEKKVAIEDDFAVLDDGQDLPF